MFLLLVPVGCLYPRMSRERLRKQRADELQTQFKDAILALSSGLNAGYSVEHAFAEALGETDRVFGPDSMISRELRLIIHKIRLNRTVEEALADFAERSGLEDVRHFSDVFLAARGNGGELMQIIGNTVEIISEKTRVQQDIRTATAARRMEQRIMNAVPIGIVLYLDLASPGFFDVLYQTMAGRIIMTGCLAVYAGSIALAGKILEIAV